MNKTTLSCLFIAALVLTQPTQIKSGIPAAIGTVAITVAAVYAYIKYQECHKDELPDPNKLIDKGAEGLKNVIDKLKKVKVE